MPILRVKEIRDMSGQDRRKRLREMQTELVRLKTMIKAGGAVENPARVKELRRVIARVLTIENQPLPPPKEEKKEEKKTATKKEAKKETKTETKRVGKKKS